ncbi:uncharacterized protein LOC132264337 [Phlebotomus argentipes]|uniref:uncharacterized protein LOC132264337 n=1 Tax=Phlebotomus argentipes TaxID=94469 RepID=UPI0028933028|nr:uncharacterized protein LOC132264337 [Phlebotomus argentipes]XP_059620478.1 uncharacterized protein LOC132264337 [Phlebotomus argentipes]
MVRVLSVYQFTEEGGLTISDDINASCLVPPDRIAIATSGLDVEIRSLAGDAKDSFTFPAVDEIEEIHYCRNGNYLVTIESKEDNRNIKWRIVRIYCNWDGASKSKSMAILRARIAGKVTPSDKYINSEDVEMIELPLKTQPRCVACCQVTGNIAIVAGNKVLFYQFRSCKTDTGRYNYIDFVEVPFFVELSFSPQKITLTEGVIACMSDFTFNLFKITEVYEPSISVDISDESFSSDASGSIRINTKDTLDFRTICKHSTINKQKFRVQVASDSDENGANVDVRPEIVHDMLIILRSLQDSETLSKYTIKPLLQLRLPCPVSQKPIYESFKSMSVNPLYMRREMCPEKSSENIFGSNYSRNFVSVALVVATQQDGYLYQFYNNDEWRQNTDILATYSFTAPIVDLILKDSVLHVLTEVGVETYTLRIGQKIFYSPCEYFLNYSTTLDVIGPNFNDPICLLGIHTFSGAEKFITSSGNLVIFSRERRQSHSWRLKVLQEPKAEQLYRSIEGYALKHRAENPKVFLHLMGEIHVMIRTANELARMSPVENMRNQVSLAKFLEHGDKEVENLFLESCRTLADFFVLSANEEEFYMALPYYLMGKLSVADIFNRCIQFEQLGVYSMGGIIYTLKQLFLRLQPGSEEMNFLTGDRAKTPLMDNNNGNEMRVDRDGGFMKALFDLLLKYSPGDITTIALQSSTFLNRMGEYILDFLEAREEKTNEEKLCVALQLVRKKRATVARCLIETIDTESLLSILSKNWTILFETSMNHKNGHSIVIFSEFTEHCLLMSQLESIQRLTASVLKYLLVNLQVLPFEVLLKMLIDFTSLRIGYAGSEIGKNILMLTLEMYLVEYVEQKKLFVDQSESSDSASFIVTTSSVSNTTRSGHADSSRKMSSSMASDVDTALSIFGSAATGKAMKILVRSHLGFLSSHSAGVKKDNDLKEYSLSDYDIPEKEIDALFESLKRCKDILKEKCVDETLVFMEKRWNYLNLMPPLHDNFLDYLIKLKKAENSPDKPQDLEINVACVKLQALLTSGELPDEIVNEVSQFICSNPNLIGIESVISCLLPVSECTEFLVNVCPQCVLEYGKDRFTRNEDWAFLINCLQVQTSKAGDATESNGGLLLFYHRLLKEILEYIANTKPLETVMKIFPEHEITKIPDNGATGSSGEGKKLHSGHHPHEQSAFIQYIRVSVERERARKLRQVIVAKSNSLSAKINL